jgi:hypothetical protein
MAPVRFTFGSRPEISQFDAIELAGLLERLQVTAAFSTAGKIRFAALRGTARRRSALVLERNELTMLLGLLDDPPAIRVGDRRAPVHRELQATLRAPGPLEADGGTPRPALRGKRTLAAADAPVGRLSQA